MSEDRSEAEDRSDQGHSEDRSEAEDRRDQRHRLPAGEDPVRARRARIGRWAVAGQRLGYACLGIAVAVFVAGAATTFTSFVVAGVVASLAVGSAVLLPAIVVGFGVRAADRDERRGGARGH